MYPERAGWDTQAVLLGQTVDALHWLQWAKTKDGQKGRNRPSSVLPFRKPARRPGSHPKPQPVSKLREKIPPREDKDRAAKLSKLFDR